MKAVDITGQKFGRLTAVRSLRSSPRGKIWLFRCDCGIEIERGYAQVTCGITSSCGCLRRETITKHGFQLGVANNKRLKSPQTQVYTAYHAMLQRCYNPKSTNFKNWGGRGISVCDLWRESFVDFVLHIGLPPTPKHTVGRIENSGNYEPGNVRWETRRDQLRNTRRTKFATIEGRTQCLTAWAAECGLSLSGMRSRFDRGIRGQELLAPATPRALRRW